MLINSYSPKKGFDLKFVGPPLEEGPKPALFYFALSAQDSLQKDPFNQMVTALQSEKIRIFSATLPGHENNLPPEKAIYVWAAKMTENPSFLLQFMHALEEALNSLFDEGLIEPGKCAVSGLSRGAFIAFHLAALCEKIDAVLAFAPLIRLGDAKEFKEIMHMPCVFELDLEKQADKLFNKKVCIFIGNDDRRVFTSHSFSLIQLLAKKAREERINSSPIEMIIGPSIGHLGHGTSKKTFEQGADWIKQHYNL